MLKTCRPLFAAMALLLVVATAQPVAATSSLSASRQKQQAVRQKRVKIASELNALRASDAQLTAAVKVLDRQVAAELTQAGDARQSVDAALAAVADAEARIASTETEMKGLHQAVVSRAVSAYMRPQEEMFTTVLGAGDFTEASRRSSLLAQVTNRDSDVLDRLRALREDLGDERARADKAKELADQRRREVNTRLASLETARREKQRVAGALDKRIKDYQAEADEVAKQEAGLTALIRSRERAIIDLPIDGAISGAGLLWPTKGRVTSGYGQRWGRLHAGIDIGAGSGTPIRAAKAGEVIFAGVYSGYGNCIIINHGGGMTTLYGHQSRLAARDGATVEQGQLIGYVGSTGNSTGPHLHFETRVNGSPQNPRRFLP